jgi:hypothetical protein
MSKQGEEEEVVVVVVEAMGVVDDGSRCVFGRQCITKINSLVVHQWLALVGALSR